MIKSGLSASASASASHSTRRPSASVLPTSTDRPLRVASTSPGRNALPAIAFSTAGTSTRRSARRPVFINMFASASATAAPPMSFFMSAMPAPVLMSKPPLSKHTPLPTSTTCGRPAPADQRISASRGAAALARPTAWMAGKFQAQFLARPFAERRPVPVGHGMRRRGEFSGPEIRRRGVDPVARHGQRLDGGRHVAGVGIGGRFEAGGRGAGGAPVPVEAIRGMGETHAELIGLGRGDAAGEPEAVRRQALGDGRGLPQAQGALAPAQTTDRHGYGTGLVGHQQHTMAFRAETLLGDPLFHPRRLRQAPGFQFVFMQKMQRDGRPAFGIHGAFLVINVAAIVGATFQH